MKRKLKLCILSIVMILLSGLLSGCSLAKEDAGESADGMEEKNADRLVGVFLTTEYLDLFDMEGYLEDNIDQIVDGGNIAIEDASKYNDRLYGTIDKHGYTEAKDCEYWEIRFAELEGIPFFYSEWQEDGQEPFSMLMSGDEICDVTQHLNVTDGGESVKLTGTIYALVNKNAESIGFYVNPVYMTEDGRYYAVSGMGHYQSGVLEGSHTVTIEEEMVKTENGEKEVYGGSVELTVSLVASEPKEIRLQYMNERLDVVHTESFASGTLPSQINLVEGTTCIVVETEWEDGSVTRELLEPVNDENTTLETFYKVNETALGKQYSEIIWK